MSGTLPFGFGADAGLTPAPDAPAPDLQRLLEVLQRSQGAAPQGVPAMASRALPLGASVPDMSDAARWNAAELARQQQISADRGLWGGGSLLEGGGPTAKGWGDVGQQYVGGLIGGTKEPGFTGVPGLATTSRDLVPGEAERVSTRVPTAVGQQIDPHTRSDLSIGIDAARNSTDAYANNAGELTYYPDLPVRGLRYADDITNTAINHMADNLVWLHNTMVDQLGQPTVDRASRWYDGANTIATKLADENGYQPFQVAGAMANLSPQKDWYQNADLGKRMIAIMQRPDQSLTPKMNDWATNYIADQAARADTPAKQTAADNLQMSLNSLQRGQTLGQINDPDTRALFVRAYDEAHNSRNFPIITPEGDAAGLQTNKDGSPSNIGWGSFLEIRKALEALEAPDVATVSQTLGGNHKVRSFYNNIISPDAPQGDTTIDTHAVAALHLRPLGGGDQVVANGLGMSGSSDASTGSKGMYGINHEAYQQATDRLNQLPQYQNNPLLPRQLQSIAWEGVRGLFSPEQKRDVDFYNRNWDIWNGFRNGQYNADVARQMVLQQAGGLKPPSWAILPPETR